MSIFTALRYAKRGICRRRVSVRFSLCVYVCVSATLQYCIKTAKRRITQIMPHYRPGTQMGCFVVAEFLLRRMSRSPSAIAEFLVVNYISHRTISRTESHTSLARLVAHRSCSANSIITQIQLYKPQYCTRRHSPLSYGKNWVISATEKLWWNFLSIHCIKPLLTQLVVFLAIQLLNYIHTAKSHNR